MFFKSCFRILCLWLFLFHGIAAFAGGSDVPRALGGKLLIGYWHNFDNGSGYIRLRDVSPAYDVVQVAFAETADASQRMIFVPFHSTESEFKGDIAALQ